jgi:hypothetical protein
MRYEEKKIYGSVQYDICNIVSFFQYRLITAITQGQ